MLKVGGIYVSPFEVEGALCTHPDVLEAAVVAWPDEDELIKPKAFVVLKAADKAGDDLARALQEHVKTALAPYKYPRWIEFRSRAAEDRDRQDPALQAAGGSNVMGWPNHWHGLQLAGWIERSSRETQRFGAALARLGLSIAREVTRAETASAREEGRLRPYVFAGWCRERPNGARPNLRLEGAV